VKRGKQGERAPLRPSDEKFMDNSNFLMSDKYRTLYKDGLETENGGYWLGNEFHKSIGEKPFSV
jgi:hypothetical protein